MFSSPVRALTSLLFHAILTAQQKEGRRGMNIGDMIAEYRMRSRMTQEQLGERLGVSNRAVSKWECGESLPGADMIPAIASALNCTPNDLYGIGDRDKPTRASELSDLIEEAVQDALGEVLPDTLRDVLPDILQDLLNSRIMERMDGDGGNGDSDGYSLLVSGPEGIARFRGEADVTALFGGNNLFLLRVFSDKGAFGVRRYDSREEAERGLVQVFDAYKKRLASISL